MIKKERKILYFHFLFVLLGLIFMFGFHSVYKLIPFVLV